MTTCVQLSFGMRVTDSVAQDDPFYEEISDFIDAIEHDDVESRGKVLSSYADALKTYEFVSCYRCDR